MLQWMLITNKPSVARYAEACGVGRIFVDMEVIGKQERQGGLDSHMASHTLADVARVRDVLTKAELMVRLNPLHSDTPNEIEGAITDFGQRAQAGTIGLDDLTGGTFTISNGGVFGSMLSTPILNPPQSAILGMHATQMRPVVEDGEIVARPMMYLALSYDHRIVDGREAVQFLVTIKQNIEDPGRLLLEA